MNNHPFLAWAVSIFFALIAISFVIQLVDDAGDPIVLDPNHKLELPPPPQSMYRIGNESQRHPTQTDQTPSPSRSKHEENKTNHP